MDTGSSQENIENIEAVVVEEAESEGSSDEDDVNIELNTDGTKTFQISKDKTGNDKTGNDKEILDENQDQKLIDLTGNTYQTVLILDQTSDVDQMNSGVGNIEGKPVIDFENKFEGSFGVCYRGR